MYARPIQNDQFKFCVNLGLSGFHFWSNCNIDEALVV